MNHLITCCKAQGILSKDVPIIVFQIEKIVTNNRHSSQKYNRLVGEPIFAWRLNFPLKKSYSQLQIGQEVKEL